MTARASATEARLGSDFFARDPASVARELIGCELLREGVGGTVVETEAYHESEPACHAYVGSTARTRVLFGPPGRAYVYLSYGIHQLFNVVTCGRGEGAAVLVRALVPSQGLETMRARRPARLDHELCSGPGKLTVALGIGPGDNGADLAEGPIEIRVPPEGRRRHALAAGPRIGVSKAAELPWRWCAVEAGRYLSAPPGPNLG